MISPRDSEPSPEPNPEPFSLEDGLVRYAANPLLEVKFRLDEPAEVEKLVGILNSLNHLVECYRRSSESRASQVEGFVRHETKVLKAFRRHLLAVTETLAFHRDAGLSLKFPRATEVFDLLVSSTDDLETALRRPPPYVD